MYNDTPQDNPRKLFVGNIPWSVTEDQMRDMFSEFGEVESVRLITDRNTGRSKGIAFVEMGSEEQAQAAIAGLHGTELEGRDLVVNIARPRQPRDDSRGGGGYSPRNNNRGGYNDRR